MSRTARIRSETGIYHVMLRGINRQKIFLDAEDNLHFLEILRKCSVISGFQLFAYCLMGNHVHLLIKIGTENLGLVMKRIGIRYSGWYNQKYNRIGHLFQDRYKSEPVQDEKYFFTVLRYIIYNPVKAGICVTPLDYSLSSARDYFTGGGITETFFAENIMGRTALLDFLSTPCNEVCLDIESAKMTDHAAWELINDIVGETDFKLCSKFISENPAQVIPVLRNAGMSIRLICRLTGLSFGFVRKY